MVGDERPIGPTQAFLVPFDGNSIPRETRHGIEELTDNQSAVRLLEVLVLHRGRSGVIEGRQPGGLGAASGLLEQMGDPAAGHDARLVADPTGQPLVGSLGAAQCRSDPAAHTGGFGLNAGRAAQAAPVSWPDTAGVGLIASG